MRERILCLCALTFVCPLLNDRAVQAQPDGFQGVVAEEKWIPLHVSGRRGATSGGLPKDSRLISIEELQLTGPKPSHPFVLGNFAVDGKWGLVNGYVQRTEGHNAALQLAWADQFELEGVMEQADLGGWFFLLGWDQGRGYAVHNVTLKDSGSPWFVSEFRGHTAIEGGTEEFPKFEWRREQPFKATLQNDRFSLEVGRFKVFNQHPLERYSPGMLVLGVYDTRYGPKPLRIKSLRIRALAAAQDE